MEMEYPSKSSLLLSLYSNLTQSSKFFFPYPFPEPTLGYLQIKKLKYLHFSLSLKSLQNIEITPPLLFSQMLWTELIYNKTSTLSLRWNTQLFRVYFYNFCSKLFPSVLFQGNQMVTLLQKHWNWAQNTRHITNESSINSYIHEDNKNRIWCLKEP